jgi:hypothetical protein
MVEAARAAHATTASVSAGEEPAAGGKTRSGSEKWQKQSIANSI